MVATTPGNLGDRSLVLIWAMDRKGVIGRDGQLPWRLSDDLKHFKRTTLGAPIIMGRKTFDSIGKPLPKRTNIAISRTSRTDDGVHWVTTIEEALAVAIDHTVANESIFVAGGSTIYQTALPVATHAHVTFVAADVEGDVVLPFAFPTDDWAETAVQEFAASPVNEHAFSIRSFERIRSFGHT